MPSKSEKLQFIKAIVSDHERFWEDQRAEMERYRNVYETRFYKNGDISKVRSQLRVEVSDGYNFIEGFVASLFTKDPSVTVSQEATGKGSIRKAQEVANRILSRTRTNFEQTSRFSLIYPQSYIKWAAKESGNPLDRVQSRSIPPWEVIIDRDACDWESQRYVGHLYHMPVSEARQRFGAKDFKPVPKVGYFDTKKPSGQNDAPDIPDAYLYIKVAEIYDLTNDTLLHWTPHWKGGDEILEEDPIPLTDADGRPCLTIIPLYYGRSADAPLIGYSAMSRVYDQIFEKNIVRSFWANAIRRDTRQYIYKKGEIDEESLARVAAGEDGAFIPVDAESLAGVISEIPVTPISSNHDRYLLNIDQDLAKAAVLAPFTRGEATKASATEIAALNQYTTSEVGRLARDRDIMIEKSAEIVIRIILSLFEEDEKPVIVVNGIPETITREDLEGPFRIVANDQGSTPVSDAARRNQLIQLAPLLVQLGADPKTVREEIVRQFSLDEKLAEQPEQPPAPPTPPQGAPSAAAADQATEQQLIQQGLVPNTGQTAI